MADWHRLLEPYNDIQREALEHAAQLQAERIEKAALDPTNSTVQDGIDIGELWFAVVRRREELRADVAGEDAAADATPEPAQEPVEPQPEESPEDDAPEPAEAPQEPADETPEDDLDALVARAKELGLKGPLKTMKPDTLRKKIAEAEAK